MPWGYPPRAKTALHHQEKQQISSKALLRICRKYPPSSLKKRRESKCQAPAKPPLAYGVCCRNPAGTVPFDSTAAVQHPQAPPRYVPVTFPGSEGKKELMELVKKKKTQKVWFLIFLKSHAITRLHRSNSARAERNCSNNS